MRKTIAVSCEGDSDFRSKLKLLAQLRGKTVGEVVRDAIDLQYEKFFASSGQIIDQLNQDLPNPENN